MNKLVLIICSAGLFAAVACSKNSSNGADPQPVVQPQSNPAVTAAANKVAEFNGVQVTGVTATPDGRIFANFPRWRDGVPFSVVEIAADGTYKPYPNADWNKWSGQPAVNKFTCIQSVVASQGSLYVLDPASPEMQGVVGKAKLFQFDLSTNQLIHTWEFDESIAPQKSYLNDLRIDQDAQAIYITDSGLGALVVLDMKTGVARRLLADRPSTKAEPRVLTIGGKAFVKPTGVPQRLNIDGIALNAGYLYYHALTAYHLYRIPTAVLNDVTATDDTLQAAVEDLGVTPAPDGMIFDKAGNLYMADLEHNSIVYRTPAGQIKVFAQDPSLHWADTFTIDNQNNLIFTDSHLDQSPPMKPATGITYTIHRMPLPAQP